MNPAQKIVRSHQDVCLLKRVPCCRCKTSSITITYNKDLTYKGPHYYFVCNKCRVISLGIDWNYTSLLIYKQFKHICEEEIGVL